MGEAIKNRYEFVVLFDVENGNPKWRSGCWEYAAYQSGNRLWDCNGCMSEA